MVLGYSGVDISSKVKLISRLLIKGPVSNSLRCEVLEELNPSWNGIHEFQIRLLAHESLSWISGSGRNARIGIAWIKALMELSEALIARGSGLQSRVGLAGGLCDASAIARAKAECIERDAFLYHYQSGESAQYVGNVASEVGIHLEVYRLASAFHGFETCLVWDRQYSTSGSGGLSFGTSAASDFSLAKSEAIREWASTRDVLMKRALDLCRMDSDENQFSSSSNPKRIHLDACFDRRNIDRFNRCFRREQLYLPNRSMLREVHEEWLIRTFESPIHFGKFVHASHPALESLFFGHPEPLSALEDQSAPLFHPFW